MQRARVLHANQPARRRQLRWVVPMLALLAAATLATLVVQYRVSDQTVGNEFFRAHKTISHTGELLQRGFFVGVAVLALTLVAVGVWAFRLTHRIVAPLHTLHRALDAIMGGDLGVRVELHPGDEFQELGQSLNRLVEEFGATLARVHTLADGVRSAAADLPRDAGAGRLLELATELDRTLDFFRLTPRRIVRENETSRS
jgi:methyl-accepting chemotaxis protein